MLQRVIRQGMLMVAGGLLLGFGGVFALARLIRSMLYGVSSHDPQAFLGVSVSVLPIALAACLSRDARHAGNRVAERMIANALE